MFQRLNLCRLAIALALLSLLGWEGVAGMPRAEAQDSPLWTPRSLGSGEMPLPDRVALADLIVIGRIDALEDIGRRGDDPLAGFPLRPRLERAQRELAVVAVGGNQRRAESRELRADQRRVESVDL